MSMIKSIKIQNFLRIDEMINVDLGPLTVLVGENGSGKSSVLKAVHWAIRCATLADWRGKVTLEQMDFVPSKEFLDLPHKLKLQNSAAGRKIVVSVVDQDDGVTEIRIGSSRNDAGVSIAISGPMKGVLTQDEKPSTAYIPGLAGAAEEETILAVPVLHRKASSGEGGSVLRQIMLALAGGDAANAGEYRQLEDLSKWVSKILPETQFWVKFDRLRDRTIDVKFLTPEMRVPGQSHQVAWKPIDMAGTGFLQVVQIFAYLLYFRPKILLVDEPDAHLHSGRQQRLIVALEEAVTAFQDTQIIITTHSSSLVRALSPSAKIHWLESGRVRAEGDLVRERMGWSILDRDIIIFSEDSNSKYLQAILDQWPDIAHRCVIWPTFGRDALPSGDKAKKISDRMNVKVLIHRDRDFMSDEDVADWRRYKEYDVHNISLWVTDGCDIEDYFCERQNIARKLELEEYIVDEIYAEALNFITEAEASTLFSNAYTSAVSKLRACENRNPISRWRDLGGYGLGTIKGKKKYELIYKACAEVLPRHGLGRHLGNRGSLISVSNIWECAISLKHQIEAILVVP